VVELARLLYVLGPWRLGGVGWWLLSQSVVLVANG
jgi:hypothetical protein